MKSFIKNLLRWGSKSAEERNILRYRIANATASFRGLLPIPLWRVMVRHGTDKHKPGLGWHHYGHTYGRIFNKLKYRKIKLLEIGIGGSSFAIGGQSLLAWKEYFPFGSIVGCDIEPKFFLTDRRIRIYQIDQSSRSDLAKLKVEQAPFDIVIDDGSHVSRHQIFTFYELFGSVQQGGFYVIEDVQTSFWPGIAYGMEMHGAHIDQLEFRSTCVGHFIELAKYLNHNEFVVTRGVNPDMLAAAKQITRITFEHNLIIIEKGPNDEPSKAKDDLTLVTENL